MTYVKDHACLHFGTGIEPRAVPFYVRYANTDRDHLAAKHWLAANPWGIET
jgi:hypothetical protein